MMNMDIMIDSDEEDFCIGPFGGYDKEILKRCLVPCGPDGVPFHNLCDKIGTITGDANNVYTSNSWTPFRDVDSTENAMRGGVTFETIGMILSANLWLHLLIDDPEVSLGNTSEGMSVRYNLDEMGWMLANRIGCSTAMVHDMLHDTMMEIHIEQVYADKYQQIASRNNTLFEDSERLSRMVEVLIRSPFVMEPACMYDIINTKLLKWLGVPYIDDKRYDQILDIIKKWDKRPVGLSALAYSSEVIEYKYQKMAVEGVTEDGRAKRVVVCAASNEIQELFQILPGYNARACSMFMFNGELWLGEVHVSYRWTDFKNGSDGTDRGAYVHHVTFYPSDANILTNEGVRGDVSVYSYVKILKDVNKARCAMYQGSNEGYNMTRKTDIGGEGGMWSHVFDSRGGYPKWCVATRRRVGPNESAYVEMYMDDMRRTVVQVEDRSIRQIKTQYKEGLGGKKQFREHFESDLVKRLINGDAMTMNGDTTVNIPAKYIHTNAPMKIAHAAMAYTRIKSAIEDVSNSFNTTGNEIEIVDYHRNANSFIVLLNVLLSDNPPIKLKTIGDGCIKVDVFDVSGKMRQMGITQHIV